MSSGARLVAREVVLVTGNAHKVDELAASLPGVAVRGLRLEPEPEETGATYAENAGIKAHAGHRQLTSPVWVVGEDSGIEVDALDGAPGIHSARWADDGPSRLLAELAERPDRECRYACAIVALAPDGEEHLVEGVLEGSIAHDRRGAGGFGYDPIFIPRGETLTVAELGDDWKRQHSHRARAAALLRALLDA